MIEDRLQEAFWIDFGSILGGFGKGFGRVWGRLGRDLGAFGSSWGNIGKDLGIWNVLGQILEIYRDLELAGTYLDIRPPRWSATRHNARGSWTSRVKWDP